MKDGRPEISYSVTLAKTCAKCETACLRLPLALTEIYVCNCRPFVAESVVLPIPSQQLLAQTFQVVEHIAKSSGSRRSCYMQRPPAWLLSPDKGTT